MVLGGGHIYGLTTEPNVNTTTATGDWGTAANIFTSVIKYIAAEESDGFYGPFGLYVHPTQYAETLAKDAVESFASVRDRIVAMPQIKSFKPSVKVTAGTAILVQLTPDVADVAIAVDVQAAPSWTSPNGMNIFNMIFGAMAPRIKADQEGHSGILVATGN
jgi:uncharacterized linocin/CFP29 family protein